MFNYLSLIFKIFNWERVVGSRPRDGVTPLEFNSFYLMFIIRPIFIKLTVT